MLKIKTYLAPSTISGAGLGCFAAENISAGTIIWTLNPLLDRIYTEENLVLLSEHERKFIETYAYRNNGLYYLCVDNGRFINHSDKPNTFDPNNEYATYAAKDIKIGDEILSDYRTFGITSDDLRFNMI